MAKGRIAMENLKELECTVCREGAVLLEDEEIQSYMDSLPLWHAFLCDGIKQLERTYKFPDFKKALEFTNRIGMLAEEAGHHPTLITGWGKVTVIWWTHKINGLHKNDFIMAAKTDHIYDTDFV
jgi:4a-hydroxytetrahydrobiopterin dehydratase